MRTWKRSFPSSLLSAGVAAVAAFLPLACTESAAERGEARAAATPPATPTTTISPSTERLLDLAAKAAGKMPLDPHVKNRSRAQESVVAVCLELDQPSRALAVTESIADWRRAACAADLAAWHAARGDASAASPPLELARALLEDDRREDEQDWQREHVVRAIARAEARLDPDPKAPPAAADVDAALDLLARRLASSDFDGIRASIAACCELFESCYADEGRRGAIESAIRSSWARLPATIRVETLVDLAGRALDRGDATTGLRLVADAEEALAGCRAVAEYEIPMHARIAALRRRGGDEVGARGEATLAIDRFEERRASIVDIYRCGALIPVAETWHTLGDDAKARSIYARAVDEALVNPNSRPRSQDLVALCCSMARNDVEPGEELLDRLVKCIDGLGHPW